MSVDFTGRAVLVTGGTKGIGYVIARTFLAAGADVIVCGRTEPDANGRTEPGTGGRIEPGAGWRSRAELPPAAEGRSLLPATGGRRARFVAADVRDPAAAVRLVERAVERFGRLDVLVNNAGGSPDADAATVSPRFVERVVALNLLAPFYVAQPANQVMRSQDTGGSIINIGSVSGADPQPGTAAYSAAKAGLLTLTRALALEWSPKVRVNHVTVGPTASAYGEGGGAAVAGVIPMGRTAAPADVANACLFLASDLASYLTGADLAVHGGGELPARYLAARS